MADRATIVAMLRRKAVEAGLDPDDVVAHAAIETGGTFDPKATNGKYKGLFQFGPSEWQTYGGGKDISDPEAQADAYIKARPAYVGQFATDTGLDPSQVTGAQTYLAFQQGGRGASSLVHGADRPAKDVLGEGAYNGNLPADVAKQGLTGRQFIDYWAGKFAQHKAAINGQPDPSNPQFVGAGNASSPGAGFAQTSDVASTKDADLAGYGGSNPTAMQTGGIMRTPPSIAPGGPGAGGAVARANSSSLGDTVRNGLALMQQGQPPTSAPPGPATSPIHKPEQLQNLLAMLMQQQQPGSPGLKGPQIPGLPSFFGT